MSKILIVRNKNYNESISQFKKICKFLKATGNEIIVAETHETALQIVQKRYEEFSMIIFDKTVPKVPGIELLGRLQITIHEDPRRFQTQVTPSYYCYLTKIEKREQLKNIAKTCIK